ncbi:MAG: serine/threonine protein kinase [Proteobacteria bacterium]|nr:serine/threonine protein kinase [Pseudomonadota bacterium]
MMNTHEQQLEHCLSSSSLASKSDSHFIDLSPELCALLKDKYIVNAVIGNGAQGVVYGGIRLADNQKVAIKLLNIHSVSEWKQYELFNREAQVLKRLDVPGVAKFYESIEALNSEKPTAVIIQEYIEGHTLQYYLDNHTRFSFEDSCGILKNLLSVIHRIHTQYPPVIHRDIKPSNVILRYGDGQYSSIPEVFLIDFGAVANPQVKDGGSTVTGTYGYMAPEQLIGKPTPLSDIYSFGVLAVYLLSGVPPEKIETRDLKLLIDPHLEHLPHAVTEFLWQLLETNPEKRLGHYAAINRTLTEFQQHQFHALQTQTKASSVDVEAQLESVRSIGQHGNIVIWQALSDTVPRKLPKAYQMMLKDANRYRQIMDRIPITLREIHEAHPLRALDSSGWIKAGKIFGIVQISLVVLPMVVLAFYFGIYLLGVGALLVGGLFAWLSLKVVKTRAEQEHDRFIQENIELCKQNGRQPFERIFTHGRKSLAEVQNITLLQAVSNSYLFQLRKYESSAAMEHLQQRCKPQKPVWKIDYFFNPPDDNSPYPVIHSYYSELPPTDIKIGDTIPILYYIQNGFAHSTPYPLPISASFMMCNFARNSCLCEVIEDSQDGYFKKKENGAELQGGWGAPVVRRVSRR